MPKNIRKKRILQSGVFFRKNSTGGWSVAFLIISHGVFPLDVHLGDVGMSHCATRRKHSHKRKPSCLCSLDVRRQRWRVRVQWTSVHQSLHVPPADDTNVLQRLSHWLFSLLHAYFVLQSSTNDNFLEICLSPPPVRHVTLPTVALSIPPPLSTLHWSCFVSRNKIETFWNMQGAIFIPSLPKKRYRPSVTSFWLPVRAYVPRDLKNKKLVCLHVFLHNSKWHFVCLAGV